MRKTILFILLLSTFCVSAQYKVAPKKAYIKYPISDTGPYAMPSKNYDTLFIKNDTMAHVFINVWKLPFEHNEKKPVLILCNDIFSRERTNYIRIIKLK